MLKIFQNILHNMRALKTIDPKYTMSKEVSERLRSPLVNVDGTPMIGNYDIHGRSFGATGPMGSSKY